MNIFKKRATIEALKNELSSCFLEIDYLKTDLALAREQSESQAKLILENKRLKKEISKLHSHLEIEQRIVSSDQKPFRDAINELQSTIANLMTEVKELKEKNSKLNLLLDDFTQAKQRKGKNYSIPNHFRDSRFVSKKLREAIILRDKNICGYCGRRVENGNEHIDHVYPHSHGGKTCESNLILSCKDCNERKGAKIGIWPVYMHDSPRLYPS